MAANGRGNPSTAAAEREYGASTALKTVGFSGHNSVTELTLKYVEELCGKREGFEDSVGRLLTDAAQSCNLIYGIKEALEWGNDFNWPAKVLVRDTKLAESVQYDLELMVQQHHQQRSMSRLSAERIARIVPSSDPDYSRILDLADGMRVFIANTFMSNNEPPPLRKLYVQVACAVNKILLDSWSEGLVFIVPLHVAKQHFHLHYSPVHWTTKVGKKCGRNLFDSSDDSRGPCLNSEDARVMLENYYGTIEHPTITDVAIMINKRITEVQSSNNSTDHSSKLILWKADLKGAFTLLNFRPEHVKYLACLLTDDLVLIYHTGLFGWTGTPYAFQVITRIVKRLLRKAINEYIEMYVDDIIGICFDFEFQNIKEKVIQICEGLLGPSAIAIDKWDSGRQLDVLGWHINLDNMRVSIARRNFLKVVCGFFDMSLLDMITVHELERLASWSSRYTTILRHAAPLSSILYNEFRGYRNRNVSIKPSSLCRSAIILWRCLLCLLEFDPLSYSRALNSFSYHSPSYQIGFDASLTGIGVGITCLTLGQLVTVTSFSFPFNLESDSKYQNTVEFIAVVTGIWLLYKRGIKDCTIELKGDSQTALKWGETERFKGILNLGSVITFILLGTRCNIWVSSSIHVAGEDNTFYDQLSRGATINSLGLNDIPIINLQDDPSFIKLIELCNPRIDYVEQENSFILLWKQIWKLIH